MVACMLTRGLVLLICLAPQALAQSGAVAPRDSARPLSAAESLQRKLESLKNSPPAKGPARVVELSDVELTEYFNTTLRAKLLQGGVSDARLQIDRDRLQGSAVVDLDLVRRRLPEGVGGGGLLNPLSYLSGKVPSDFSGRLVSNGGFASFDLEGVHFGPVTVPVSVVSQMIASSTKNSENPGGVDIHAPFRLPYAIKRVRLQPGKALIEY
jgi:hypothetical protein